MQTSQGEKSRRPGGCPEPQTKVEGWGFHSFTLRLDLGRTL
jgi:hypothetical protein